MKKRTCLRGRRALLVMVLVAGLTPVGALGAVSSADPQPDDAMFYLFSGDQLGDTADGIAVRFEYRSDGRLLRDHDLTVSLGRGELLLVPIPPLVWPTVSGALDIELVVFANELLVARFDGESLLRYNRNIRRTHPELVAALSLPQPDDSRKSPMRRISARIECNSPCGGGCTASGDYDCDGVANSIDNCTDISNSGQEDCDGDGWGDACDEIDGIFETSGRVMTCHTDKDEHLRNQTWEHHVEQRLVDVSACGSPDRWNRWIRFDDICAQEWEDRVCCEKLSTSIREVGDDPNLWCGAQIDENFCH